MRRFQFELAEDKDDAELRHVLAATPMEGAVSLAFAREPSYFAAGDIDGDHVQVGVVRDRWSGRIVGMGSRAISKYYVNGCPQQIGYLSGLRLLPEFRGMERLLVRAYGFLRELHEDGRVPYYLTTIADDNDLALRLLAGQRAGLPMYHFLGKYVTLVMGRATLRQKPRGRGSCRAVADNETAAQQELRPLGTTDSRLCLTRPKARRDQASSSIDVRWATAEDRGATLAFLRDHGPRRQFFPALDEGDLFADRGRLKGLKPRDTLLALREGQIVGTLGFWNQSSFKQVVVAGYDPWTRWVRPLYNQWAHWQRLPKLPAAGERLPAMYGAIPVVRNDDTSVFRQLVSQRPASDGRDHHSSVMLLGLSESDPLLPVARKMAVREYVTRIYVVYWKGESPDMAELTRRVPYLELGCL